MPYSTDNRSNWKVEILQTMYSEPLNCLYMYTNFLFLTFILLDVYQWQLHLHWSAWLPMSWVADDMTLSFNNGLYQNTNTEGGDTI